MERGEQGGIGDQRMSGQTHKTKNRAMQGMSYRLFVPRAHRQKPQNELPKREEWSETEMEGEFREKR